MAGLVPASGALEAAAAVPQFPLHWHFGQVFGEHQPGDEVQQGESGRLVGIPEQCTTTRLADRPPLTRSSRACPPADVLSTVEFDSTGEQLATGDRGGRVVLFEREDGRPEEVRLRALQTLLVLCRV